MTDGNEGLLLLNDVDDHIDAEMDDVVLDPDGRGP